MRKINNNYLGDFYIEELENREKQDRVKLYDSDEKYLDYLPLERYDDTDPTFEEQYEGYVAYCPHCGSKMMLCDECIHSDNAPICDWNPHNGCCREREKCKKETI